MPVARRVRFAIMKISLGDAGALSLGRMSFAVCGDVFFGVPIAVLVFCGQIRIVVLRFFFPSHFVGLSFFGLDEGVVVYLVVTKCVKIISMSKLKMIIL